jgi:hypothetical protein
MRSPGSHGIRGEGLQKNNTLKLKDLITTIPENDPDTTQKKIILW